VAPAANTSPVLLDAYRSYRAGRYADAAVLLENLASSGARDPYPLLLLSLAHLQLGRFARSDEILKKIAAVDQHYRPYNQLRAYLYMKGAPDFESALSLYVDLIGKYPGDRTLARAQRVLRKARDFERFQREAKLDDFVQVPRPPRGSLFGFTERSGRTAPVSAPARRREFRISRRLKRKLAISVALAAAIAGAAALFMARGSIGDYFRERAAAPSGMETVDQVTLDGSGFDLVEKISRTRRPEFYYSGTALRDDFLNSKQLIRGGRYNDALLLINKILSSNANMPVKERASFLRRFIVNIEDREWADIPLKSITERPHLYGGVSVLWRGRVANLKKRQGAIVFNLLVDYRSEDVFAGVADVFLEAADDTLKNGDMVEMKAVFMDMIAGGNPYLRAREIVKSGR